MSRTLLVYPFTYEEVEPGFGRRQFRVADLDTPAEIKTIRASKADSDHAFDAILNSSEPVEVEFQDLIEEVADPKDVASD
jgi:hypothetical protein